jgi:hypothetical protein
MAKRTNISQSNLTGTRAAEWLLQKKQSSEKMTSVIFPS